MSTRSTITLLFIIRGFLWKFNFKVDGTAICWWIVKLKCAVLKITPECRKGRAEFTYMYNSKKGMLEQMHIKQNCCLDSGFKTSNCLKIGLFHLCRDVRCFAGDCYWPARRRRRRSGARNVSQTLRRLLLLMRFVSNLHDARLKAPFTETERTRFRFENGFRSV